MDDLLGHQVQIAIILPYVLEWLKSKPWFPLIRANSLWLNRITAGVAALVTAGVLHYNFAADGSFTFSGNIYTMAHVMWAASTQYAMQHFVYKTAIAPPPTPVLTKTAIEAKEKP
jgi:hypothetical protein